MSDPRLKQLKIKTGVLKRVGKEKLSYRNLIKILLPCGPQEDLFLGQTN
jgi:hypothetical protein